MTHGRRRLSIGDYLALFVAVARAILTFFTTSVTAVVRGKDGASTYKHHVLFATMRKITSLTSVRGQMAALSPTTSETYERFMRGMSLDPRIVKIADTVGCWIGDPDAHTVILWFHGGAYAMMAGTPHMQLLWDMVVKAAAQNKSVAIFLVQYDLAPQAVFPTQLIQGTAALQYLLRETKRPCSELILAGDSAGANLCLGLISHLKHPQDQIPVVSDVRGSFKGLALISPWVTFDQTAPAFKANKYKDVLSGPALANFSKAFIGQATRSNYNEPLDADPDWWENLPVDSILLLAGKDELFVDDIVAFGRKLKVHNGSRMEELIAEGEPHDSPYLDFMLGTGQGQQTTKLIEWTLGVA